jgi:DNA-directed RNA polymerase specialized sigma24 family protein
VLFRFFRKIQDGAWQFESPEKLKGFLLRVARAKVIDKVRQYHPERSRSADEWDGPDDATSPAELAEQADILEQFYVRLDEVDRKILLLRMEDHTWDAIAAQFERETKKKQNPHTLQTRYYRRAGKVAQELGLKKGPAESHVSDPESSA